MSSTRPRPAGTTSGGRRRWSRAALVYFLVANLVFPAWIFSAPARAAYVDNTAPGLPDDTDTSYDFAVADVTGDGLADVLVAGGAGSRLLVSNGDGTFTDDTDARLPALGDTVMGAVFADLNGDGDPDLYLATTARDRLLLNDGSGVFTDETAGRLPTLVETGTAVAAADVDGDGDQDLVVANRGTPNRLLLNDGSGNLTVAPAGRLPADDGPATAVVLTDLNGDGAPDLYFTNEAGPDTLLTNNGLGTFAPAAAGSLPATAGGHTDVLAVDVDGDGDPDLVLGAGDAGVRVLVNDGGAAFTDETAARIPALALYAIALAAADVDEDGDVDLVLANAGADQALVNDGTGVFEVPSDPVLPADPEEPRSFGIAALDADADLDDDLLLATPQGRDRLLINDIPFPRLRLAVTPDYIEAGDTVTITVASFDEDGVAGVDLAVRQPDDSTATPTDTGGGVYTFVPAQVGDHTVVATATDTLGNAGTRTISFLAQAPDTTAPTVTLTTTAPSPLLAGHTVGFQVDATDDRVVVSRALTVNGTPVALDTSGAGSYTTTAAGDLTVVASATDAAGNTGTDDTVLTVAADGVVPTVAVTASPATVDLLEDVTISVAADDNVAVSSVEATVSGPGLDDPAPVTLDAAGTGTYRPLLPGDYTVTATATDPSGNTATATAAFTAEGEPDTEAPTVSVVALPGSVVPGDPVTLTVTAADNILVTSLTLEVNGTPVVLDDEGQATFTPPVLGDYTAVATAADPTGNTATASTTFAAVDPATDSAAPVVAITGPAEGSEITVPTAIIGTVTDLTLTEYTLAYAPGQSNDFTVFQRSGSQVTDGPLGTLDPTLMENGIYRVRLTATDIGGRTSITERTFTVTGEAKPGVLQLTFVDLRVPVAGIPLIVTRTYDSRDKTSGDFGYGWSLDIQQGEYTNNRIPGEDWETQSTGGFIDLPCGSSNETAYHLTNIKVSDRESYQFKFKTDLTGAFLSGGYCEGSASFEYHSGTLPGATLEIIGDNFIWVGGGIATNPFGDDAFEPYEPQGVRLTTIDGRVYDFDGDTGQITRIEDRDGNQVFLDDSGITHSSGAGLVVERDAADRITLIRDPKGNELTYEYDAAGDLTAFVDQEGNRTTFVYNDSHYLLEINDPLGNRAARAEYDDDGRLVAVVDAKGNRTELIHDVDANEQVTVDALGNITRTRYDAEGNVLSVEQPYTSEGVSKTAITTYEYDANGHPARTVDPDGVVSEYDYNAAGDPLQEVVDPGGLNLVTSYARNASGDVTVKTLPGGETLAFEYGAAGSNPTKFTDPAGGEHTFTYTVSGRTTSRVDPTGASADMTYDSAGRLTGETIRDPAGNVLRVMSYTYDANGNKLTETTERVVDGTTEQVTRSWTYDGLNRVVTETDPEGNTTTREYNELGRLAAVVDKRGRRTEYTYDEVGSKTRTTYPDGTFETWEYDALGRVVAETNRLGKTTRYDYDELGRRVATHLPDGTTERTVYSAAGRVLAEIGPGGARADYTYDAAGRRSSIQGPEVYDAAADALVRPQATYEYDGFGATSALVDPRGNRLEFDNDFTTRTFVARFPDGTSRTRVLDPNFRVTQVIDEAGQVTDYERDALGRVLSVTLPAPAAGADRPRWEFTYDSAGNLLTQTDALGRTTSFQYDLMNRLVLKTLPGGQTEQFDYDAAGNLLSHTDLDGTVTTFSYDDLGRKVSRSTTGGDTVTYTYNDLGQRATMVDGVGTTSYSYDADGRLTGIERPLGGAINYGYGADGKLTSITTPHGALSYQYDAMARVSQLEAPQGTFEFGYDAIGNLVERTFPSGASSLVGYDARNRAQSVSHLAPDASVLAAFDYTRTDRGRVATVTELGGATESYDYDGIGRLVREERTGADPYVVEYEYDAVGNLTRRVEDGTATAFSYDVNGQLLAAGSTTFTYDGRGNRIERNDGGTVTTYVWDALNRLESVSGPGGDASYVYDAEGRRLARVTAAGEERYVVDELNPTGLTQVVEVQNDSGALVEYYALADDLLAGGTGSAPHYFHYDGLGSTRALTDGTGSLTDSYEYLGYGALASSSGSTANDFLYSGEYRDPASGLYHLRARWYDPATGRFMSRDPFPGVPEQPLSLMPYLYAGADPINAIDPTGNFFSLAGFSVASAIQTGLRAINVARRAWTLCRVKSKIESIEFLWGFLRGAQISSIGYTFGGVWGSGLEFGSSTEFVKTLWAFEYKGPPNRSSGVKEAALKGLAKTSGSATPPYVNEPWIEASIADYDGTSAKVEGAVSSLDRFLATAALAVGATVPLYERESCGLPVFEVQAGLSWNVFGGSAKFFLKTVFFGGFGDVQLNILELANGKPPDWFPFR